MKKGLVVNWMSKEVVTVSPQTTLSDARRIMNAENIRHLPVVQDEKIIGIITRRGLLRSDLSILDKDILQKSHDFMNDTVEEIMTTKVITTTTQAPIPKAARSMMENKITGLPVLDEKRKLVGIITTSDIFRVIIDEVPGLKEDIRVKHYMTPELVTITPDTSMLEAHRLMGVKRIRALPVFDENEKMIGIVTRTDLMNADPSRFISKGHQDLSLKIQSNPVEMIMSKKVISINQDDDITKAASLMLENKIHSLPVFDKEGTAVGIITESDLFRLIVQKFF